MSELSETITHQRETHTCTYHALSKLIVQNVFQYFIAKKVNGAKYTRNQCNDYLDNYAFKHGVEPTAELCSEGGYERILQFLHVYHIISEGNRCRRVMKKKRVNYEKPVGFDEIEKTVYKILEKRIPYYFSPFPDAKQKLAEMVDQVIEGMQMMGISYIHKHYFLHPSRMSKYQFAAIFENIQKSIRKSLYVFIVLIARNLNPENEHELHAVHAVATFRNKLVIKNSWGDGLHEMDLDGEVTLHGEVYTICEVGFLIPITEDDDYSSSITAHVEGTQADDEWGQFLSGMTFDSEMNELSGAIDDVVTTSRGKEVERSIVLTRGDAVSTIDGVGIFTHYTKNGVFLFPNIEVYGIAHLADVRTVPDALDLLTSLVEEDERAFKNSGGHELSKNLKESLLALKNAKTKFRSSVSIPLAYSALIKRGEAISTSIGEGIFLFHQGASFRMRHEGVTKLLNNNETRINRIDIHSVPNGIEMLETLVRKDRNNFARFSPDNEPIYRFKRKFEESSSMLQHYLSSPSSSSSSPSSLSSSPSSSGTKKSPPSPKNTTRRRR